MRGNAVLAVDEFQEAAAVEIKNKQGCKGIFAKENISNGSIIFFLKGKITRRPTRYTIQMGCGRHLTTPASKKTNDELDYCWLYLNHNCDPNGYINTDELTFRARRDIAAGDEITFNYLTTESELAAPFTCACGATNCFGLIKGRNFLNSGELERLSGVVEQENLVKTKSGGKPAFPTARFPS